MAFEIVLPRDTQNEIEEFLEEYFVGRATKMAVVDALDREAEKLAANPTLGAVRIGTPLEKRRIHRFNITVGDYTHTIEFLYYLNAAVERITLYGFRRVPPIAL